MILLVKIYSCQNVGYFSRFVNELSAADNFVFQYFYDQWYSKASRSAYLGTIMEDKAAARAGLQVGDRILAINGEKIATWNDLVVTLQKYPDKEITVTAEHQGAVKNYQMTPAYDAQYGRPLIGISPTYEQYQPGVVEAATMGAGYTKYIIFAMIDGLPEENNYRGRAYRQMFQVLSA